MSAPRALLAFFLSASPAVPSLSAEKEAPKTPAGLKIVEYCRCPLPPNVSLTTIEPDGRASLSVTEGFDFKEGRTTRQKMRLTPKDLRKLDKLVKKSRYESLPEDATPFRPEGPRVTDSCGCSITLAREGKEKSIRYDNGYDLPAGLEKLLRGIDAVINAHAWEEDRYPWEENVSSGAPAGKAPR